MCITTQVNIVCVTNDMIRCITFKVIKKNTTQYLIKEGNYSALYSLPHITCFFVNGFKFYKTTNSETILNIINVN